MILAQYTDLDQIMEIVKDIVKEMKAEHNDQWDDRYPSRIDFLKDIERKTLYIIKESNDIVGFICIDQNQPEPYKYVNWSHEDECFVIHRLAVNPNFRGNGYAKEMFLFAEKFALENGVNYIRTDTYGKNVKMQKLFKSMGYNYTGSFNNRAKPDVYLCFEKEIS